MLKNIPPFFFPDLLYVLANMGHGDEIIIADGNFLPTPPPTVSSAATATACQRCWRPYCNFCPWMILSIILPR